jgi:hypothetical protein
MGGKSDAPDPPDYGPIAAANQQAAEYSFQLGKEQLDWAKKTYAENKAVSDVFVDKVMGMMDRQNEWAIADRNRYEQIYQPLEEQLASDAESYASPGRQEYEAGQAQADVAQKFEAARQTAQQRLESFGIDPTQTRSGALDLQTRIAEGASQAAAGNAARERTEATGRALRTEAINVGKGYPAQVQGEVAGGQGSGQAGVQSGLATTASGASTMGTAPQWQQAGQGALNSWGNTLNMGYGNELDAYKANQSQSSGLGSALGLGASLLMAPATGGGSIFSKMLHMDAGGVVPEHFAEGGMPTDPTGGDVTQGPGGGRVPVEASPSGGVIQDDVAAVVDGQGPAQLNANEFVIPEDVVRWEGEKGMQKLILKARQEMTNQKGERPAQPTFGPAQ